jgi:hypothetical protein
LHRNTLIPMTNKLLMHYGCKTATGQFTQTSYLLFFSELRLSFQPLKELYNCYGFLVTHSWMKMLWEKLSMFDMKVVVTDFAQEYPRRGNQFIMQVLLKAGYTAKMLIRLNRVQISLQLLFMLDVLTASGNKVNTNILSCCPPGEMSNMRWPQEWPTNSNLQLCKNAMLTNCPSRCKSSSVRQFLGNTHRIWRWLWCKGDTTLCCLH